MKNQEAIFADRDHQRQKPYESRLVNTDPQEQQAQAVNKEHWQVPPIAEGYRGPERAPEYTEPYPEPGQEQRGGAKISAWHFQLQRKRKKKRTMFVILALFLCFIIGFGVFGASGMFNPSPSVGQEYQENTLADTILSVGNKPTIIVNADSDNVYVSTGKDGVHLRATGYNVEASDFKYRVNEKGEVVIDATAPESDSALSIDLVVPKDANVVIKTTMGSVNIQDVQTEKITASTEFGSVDISNSNAQMDITTVSGPVSIRNSTLQEKTVLRSQEGTIDFQGSLSENGSTLMETTSGSVSLYLPDDAAFNLKTSGPSVYNDFKSSEVGSNPRHDINIKTDNGDIIVRKNEETPNNE